MRNPLKSTKKTKKNVKSGHFGQSLSFFTIFDNAKIHQKFCFDVAVEMARSKMSNSLLPPLVLAFKKGLQNHIKCRVPSKWLKFEKWSKGIKCLVFKVFSLAKLNFWIVAIFVEQWRKQVFTYGKVDFWCLLQYRQNGRVNFGIFFFQLSHIDRETRR